MSHDTQKQQALRSGDDAALLKTRLREGTLTESRLRLAAYCGDVGARELVDLVPVFEHAVAPWTTGLLSLAAACAPVVLGVLCSDCGGRGTWDSRVRDKIAECTFTEWRKADVDHPCPTCSPRDYKLGDVGTGRTTVVIPADQHLAATVGEAVARACLPFAIADDNERPEGYGAGWAVGQDIRDTRHYRWLRAIEAVSRWLIEPSEANRYAWSHVDFRRLPLWVPGEDEEGTGPTLHVLLTSAATLLSEKTVREIAAEAGRKWALRER